MARHSQDNLAVRDDFRPLDRGSICIDNGRKNGSTLFILIKRGVLLSGAIHGTLPNKSQKQDKRETTDLDSHTHTGRKESGQDREREEGTCIYWQQGAMAIAERPRQ